MLYSRSLLVKKFRLFNPLHFALFLIYFSSIPIYLAFGMKWFSLLLTFLTIVLKLYFCLFFQAIWKSITSEVK